MNRTYTNSTAYSLKTHLSGQFWLPAAIWGLFALINWLFTAKSQAANTAAYFLGVALPLIGGILSAYSILGDPALELQFSTPRSAFRTLLERMGMVLIILAFAAVTYQVYIAVLHVDMSQYGSLVQLQLTWLVPCLVMTTLGSLISLSFSQATSGALFVGLIWIVQVIIHGLIASGPVTQYIFLMMGALYPQNPVLPANEIVLVALSVVFAVLAVVLLKKQERYI
jgi:hypothetical protein